MSDSLLAICDSAGAATREKDRLRVDQRVSLCGLTKTKPMLHIIWYIIVGFIVGLLARAVMPGVQHLGFIMTTLLGIGGLIVGGLIGRLFFRPETGATVHPAGFVLCLICAVIFFFLLWQIAPA